MSALGFQPRSAWLVLAVGDDRQHGGNDGYDDIPESRYSWDSTVGHYDDVLEGDAIALWDKHTLIGASVIEEIDRADGVKLVYTCPKCDKAGFKERKTYEKRGIKRYKCYKCARTFDVPTAREKPVKSFRSLHEAGWQDLAGLLSGSELRSLCIKPNSQLSLRPLRWVDFVSAVESRGGSLHLTAFRGERLQGGHRKVSVHVRVGQAAFRRKLLDEWGVTCALTGPAPDAAVEACHLYSYAKIGEHHVRGGLLLRRDIHRLFDAGLIAVNAETLTIDLDPSLSQFEAYASLHGTKLVGTFPPSTQRWLREHWQVHRTQ